MSDEDVDSPLAHMVEQIERAPSRLLIGELWMRSACDRGWLRSDCPPLPPGFEAHLYRVLLEYHDAILNFDRWNSSHEGIAVIEEEFLELREEVFWGGRDLAQSMEPEARRSRMAIEATQLAAVAIRFLTDIISQWPEDDDARS